MKAKSPIQRTVESIASQYVERLNDAADFPKELKSIIDEFVKKIKASGMARMRTPEGFEANIKDHELIWKEICKQFKGELSPAALRKAIVEDIKKRSM